MCHDNAHAITVALPGLEGSYSMMRLFGKLLFGAVFLLESENKNKGRS